MKLSNPNDEQSVISEAKNMTKIHTKHIIEYITCWFDKSLGKYEYFFGEENDNESFSQSNENEEKNFSSSKTNKKVFKEDNNFTHQISQDQTKEDDYIKQLYEKSSFSDNEYFVNKKKLINLENKFYQKKNNEENKFKYTSKNSCLDDSLIESKINQKDIPNLNMYFFIQMEYCQGLNLSEYINNNIKTGINNKIIYLFTYQIIKSLAKIHENKIVHRGINPENIFVINESQIKIGGFSSAKEIKSSIHIKKVNKKKKIMYSQSTGNLGIFANNLQENDLDKENFGHSLYLSPEQEQGYQVTKKSDIYSAGLVIYTMCECIEKSKRQKIITDLKKKKIVSEKFKNLFDIQYKLILKMIEDDPENRPNCDILLNSEEMKKWKNSIDDN
jgi:serine/threonine protein kinase